MKDESKTKKLLIEELVDLRQRVAELEPSEAERKRAEEVLRESEEKYRHLVERANDGITVIQDGRVRFLNTRLAELWGGTVDEVVGTPFTNYVHPDELARVVDRYRRRMAGEAVSPIYETVLRHKDGSKAYAEVNAGVISYEGKPADLVIIRDITARKRAEEALQESEERCRAVVQQSADAIYLVDVETKRVLEANPAFVQMLGYTSEEILGLTSYDIVAADREDVDSRFQEILRAEGPAFFERQVRRKDGSVLNVWVSVSVISYGGKKVVCTLVRDITERKRVEEALRKSETLLQETQTLTKVGGWELDIATRRITWTDEVYRIYGVKPEEHDPSDVNLDMSFYDPKSIPILKQAFMRALNQGEPYDLELEFIRANGEHIWVRTIGKPELRDGKVVRIAGNIMDITDRKRVEGQLRLSEGRYRAIMEQSPDGIYLIDAETKRVVQANAALCRLLGYSAEEIQGLHLYDLVIADQGDIDRRFQDTADGKGPISLERRMRRKDGSVVEVWVSGDVVSFNGKRQNCVLVRDITERKRQEEKQRIECEFQNTLHQIAVGMLSQLDLMELLKTIVNKLADLIDASFGWICLVEPGQEEIELKVYAGLSHQYVGCRLRKGEGLAGQVWETNQPLAIDDYTAWPGRPSKFDDAEVGPTAAVPLVLGSEVIGVLGLSRASGGRPLNDNELEHMGRFATLASIALQNARLYSSAQQELTDRKLAEEALKESEERYRAVVEQSPDGIFLEDVETRRLLEANTTFQELLGYSLEEIRRMSIYDIVSADRQDINQRFKKILRSKGPFAHERKYRRKDGSLVHVWLSNKVISYGGRRVICTLVRDLTERKKTEEERERLLQQVMTSRRRLQLLSQRLVRAQEEERRLIARELHDEIGQSLTVAKIHLQSAKESRDQSTVSQRLNEAVYTLEGALQQVRSLSLDLRPSLLDDLGLLPTLHWYLDRWAEQTGVLIRLEADPIERRFHPDLEISCYRIVQEALTNVIRHAQAQQVTVEIRDIGDELHLIIHDDGVGFDVQDALEQTARGGSLGLLGMQERVQSVGGEIQFESAPGKGTEIRVRLSLAWEKEEEGGCAI